jgi:uncharacterized membrane protein
MNDRPPILRYENRPTRPKAERWPWAVVTLIATGSCVVYGCYFAGLISLEVAVGTIELVAAGVVLIAGIVAGIKYGTQDKDYWV